MKNELRAARTSRPRSHLLVSVLTIRTLPIYPTFAFTAPSRRWLTDSKSHLYIEDLLLSAAKGSKHLRTPSLEDAQKTQVEIRG